MKVEYLIVTQQDGCFCNSKAAFNNLLQADSQITILRSKLKYKHKSTTLEVDYSLETDEIKNKNQRYFHIKLTAKEESQIEIFTFLIRNIRKIVERISEHATINTLWDDISKNYIIQAYPLINDIENLMRKLILKFMIVNVGRDWINEAMPLDLKQQISKKADKNKVKTTLEDTLHNADFIQLSGFLFNKYRTKEINVFDSLLATKKTDDTISLDELKKDFFPQSNWDRFFSDLIKYEGHLLEKKWEKLYELRNKIAHNKTFSKSDLDEVQSLTKEISEKLNETISNLDKVFIKEEEIENIINAYQPHRIINSSNVGREEVINWYMQNFPIKHPSDVPQRLFSGFKITLIDDTNLIVLTLVALSIEHLYRRLRDRLHMIRREVVNNSDELHLVMIVDDSYKKLPLNPGIVSRVQKMLSSINSKNKIILGGINHNREFVLIESITELQ